MAWLFIIALWVAGLALALATDDGWWLLVSCIVATVFMVVFGLLGFFD